MDINIYKYSSIKKHVMREKKIPRQTVRQPEEPRETRLSSHHTCVTICRGTVQVLRLQVLRSTVLYTHTDEYLAKNISSALV